VRGCAAVPQRDLQKLPPVVDQPTAGKPVVAHIQGVLARRGVGPKQHEGSRAAGGHPRRFLDRPVAKRAAAALLGPSVFPLERLDAMLVIGHLLAELSVLHEHVA
jgi:hypothetical protein